MKKSLIFGAAALGTASFMMLSGFDSAETAESVMAKYQEASNALTETAAQVEMAADVSLEIPDAETSFDLQGQGTMDMDVTLEPLGAAVTASFSGSAMGMEGSMDFATYMVTEEDGTISVYSGTGDEWTKTTLEADVAEQLREAIANSASIDESDAPISYTLDSEPADINGTECYKLTTVLTWDDVKELFKWSFSKAEELGMTDTTVDGSDDEALDLESAYAEVESYLDMADPYVTGVQLNIVQYVDTETFYPVCLHMDLDGSDWSTLEMLTASLMGLTNEDDTLMDVNFNINSLYIDYFFEAESDAVIEVPQEAIDNAVEVSADDLTESLAGAVEGETDF